MRIEQLTFFIELVHYGSIKEASQKCYVSPQTLTYNLKSLEDEFGGNLYYYSSKGKVVLTQEGKLVYSAAQSIIKRYNKLLASLEFLKEGSFEKNLSLKGQLVINASPMISISILASAYLEYMNAFPGVQVFSMENYQNNIVQNLNNSLCDVGYILVGNTAEGFFNTIPEHVHLELLKTYQIYLAMSPSHPLANKSSLTIKDIQDYPLVIFEVGGPEGEHALKKSARIKVDLATNNHKMCHDLLQERNGLLLSFEPFIKRNIFTSFYHRPLIDENLNFHLYIAKNEKLSAKQTQLVDAFNDIFTEFL